MKERVLQLNINSSLYSKTNNIIIYKKAHELLENRLYGVDTTRYISTIDNYEKVTDFKVLDNIYNYLIMELSIYDRVHFITVDDDIEAVILNMDKFSINSVINGFTYDKIMKQEGGKALYNDWNICLQMLYKQVTELKSHEWRLLYTNNYKIISNTNIDRVLVFGKLNTNNEVMLGFKINDTPYGYFTGATNIDSRKSLINCDININNRTYNISGKTRWNCILKLYVELCKDNPNFKLKHLVDIQTDKCRITSSDKFSGLSCIMFNKEFANNISIINDANERIKVSNLIPKLKIMGEHKINNNLYIFDYIPDNVTVHINKSQVKNYDYTIVFHRLPKTI